MNNSRKDIKERREKLIEHIIENGKITIDDLAQHTSVSSITVRRDIEELKSQEIVQVKNGVVYIGENYKKKLKNYEHKNERIAIQRKAASFVSERDVIFINTSYTALGILEYVQDTFCTVVTNNTHIIDIDFDNNIVPILTGGEIRQPRSSLSGELTINAIKTIGANKCFIGVDGITISNTGTDIGFLSTSVMHEAIINETMLSSCNGKKYVVVTSDRINHSERFRCGVLSLIDCIITDRKADIMTVNELKRSGIEVIIV